MKKKSLLLILLMALLAPWAAKAQEPVPYNEGFESMSSASDLTDAGWIYYFESSSSFVGISTSQHSEGSKSLQMDNWNAADNKYQVVGLPVLEKAINTLQITVSFNIATAGTFSVGYLTSATDANTFVAIESWTNSGWQTKTVDLSSAPDGAARIAFKYYRYWRCYVDDIKVKNLPTCTKPKNLEATLTPGNGTIATLNWNAGGSETAWVLEYGTTSDFTGATSVNVSGTPTKNLKDLTAETKYYARVKADCGGGDTSEWSTTCEFTPTDQLIISILGTTGSTSSYLPSNTNYDYAYTQQIYTAEEMGGFACTLQSVAFKGNKASVCNLDIYLANTDKSSFTSTSDYIAISEATLVFSGNVTFIADDWKTIEFDNEFDYTGGNLAVIVDDNSGNYNYFTTTWQTFNTTTAQALYFYQDDTNINPSSPSAGDSGTPSVKNQIKFVYELPSPYQKPTDLTIIDVDAHTANIGWTAPNSDVLSYKYQYKEEGGEWTALKSTTATSAPLTGLTAETHHIFQVQAIYAGNNESAFASIEFDTDIACPAPTNLAATNITDESATLSWDGSASSYNVRYRAQKGFHYDFEQASAWTYDNFPPCTTYDGDGVECYGFSSETFTNFPFTGSTFAFGSQSGNLSSHSGNVFGLMVCPVDASQADDWFILPAITIKNGDVFQFYAREITTQYGDETINVGIYGDTPGTFAEVIDADVAIGETTYTLHSYDLSAYAGQTIRLAINYVSTDIFGFMFDDIFVGDPNDNTWDVTDNNVTSPYPVSGLTELTSYDFEVQANCGGETSSWVATSFTTLPSCLPVSNLAVSDITRTTVSLTWTDNNGGTASYIITDGDDNPVTVENLTITGCTVTGLTANTAYTFKVSADCGSTTVSIQARTECNVITTLPYDEGFETVTYYCWALDGFLGLNNSTYAHTGNMSIYADGSSTDPHHIIVPETDDEIDGLMLNFWYYNYNAGFDCGTLYVGYVTDPDDFTTFTEVGSIDMSSGISTYAQSQDFVFTGAPAGSRMAIDYDASGETYAYVMIDDARIDIAPNCVKPYNLVVSDETPHGATFSWTNCGSETEWHLYVSTENNAPADDINLKEVIVADSNPFTVTSGLNPENTYYAWVRASCGGTDGYSSWVGPETFTTGIACPAPTSLAYSEVTNHTAKLSWDGTSESYVLSVGTYDYTGTPVTGTILEEGFESTSMPEGWTHIGSGAAVPSTSYTHAGSNRSLEFKSATSNNVVVLPQFSAEANQLTIDFWSRAESSTLSKSGYFDLGYVTNASDASTFVILQTYSAEDHGSAYVHIENYSLSSVPDGARIAFRHRSGLTYYYWYIDDVTITGPTYPIAWDTYNTSDTQKTVEGLDPETPYFAKVKGYCGTDDGYSQETAVISFTTDIPCPAPTALTPSNPTSVSFDLSWNNGGASDWIVAYKKTTETDFTEISLNISDVTEEAGVISYTLGGLDDDTEYTVKVRDNCEPSYTGDGVSNWTAEVTYSTIPACSALNPVVSNITHRNATVNWEGESGDGYTVKYRESALVSTENPVFYEAFNTNSSTPPTGWTRYSGLVDAVIAGSTSLTTVTTGWYTNSDHALGSYNAKLNIYGINVKHWLVTPEVVLTNGLSLSFDLALTDYGNGNVIEYPEQQPDDRFVVLVFADDAWHILREWNNSGSPYVYNTIATTGENVVLDLAAYAGKTIKVAFYGESTVSGASSGVDDNDLHIDNVLIGTAIPAGDWQTQAAATTTANLTGLTAGTMYDVKIVPNCDNTIESNTVQFTTLPDNVKHFLTAGNWNDADNWMDSEIPTIADDAVIHANANIFGDAAANKITFSGSPTPVLTIENGGTLQTNTNVTAKVKKTINGYSTENNKYYLVATPLSYAGSPTNYGMITDNLGNAATSETATYDLYGWDYTATNEWKNYRASTFSLSNGTGYLYAHKATANPEVEPLTLTFTGTVKANNTDETKNLTYSAGTYDFNGWNLVGNPFVCNAYVKDATDNIAAFYRMNDAGDGFEAATGAIRPMEGIFVKATASSQSFKFTRTAPVTSNGNGNLNISLAQVVTNRGEVASTDKAIVRFDEGNTLEKFMLRHDNMKIYIPQDGTDFAVVASDGQGSLPVNVKVAKTGKYTISISNEDVDFSYLHLIDNFTGENIDLLIDPSYTFSASVRDNENRFILVFNTIDSNIDATSDIFAYQSGDEIIVNGEGELQIFDVMGRFVGNMTVNDSERISASTFANGVYVFRMVGNEVKTQKIVVR